MSILVQCSNPACGMTFPRPEVDLGRTVSCPNCNKAMTVEPALDPAYRGLKLGGCELVRPIAKGGMGEIFEARHLRLERPVAVKILPPNVVSEADFRKRFEREATVAAALNHTNIVRVYDFGFEEGHAFLVMEYVDGEDLGRRIAERGKLSVDEALGIGEAIAGALAAAHKQSIIHRDIKPANILVGKDGVPKLADLGLARSMNAGMTMTATGMCLGTPRFIAPEQIESSRRADPRSDIYSLGITLLNLMTGKSPYEGDSMMAILEAQLRQPLPSGAALGTPLPPHVETLIQRMAAKDPEERYPHCMAVVEDIHRVRRGEAPLGRAPAPVPSRPDPDKTVPMDSQTIVVKQPPKTRRIQIAGSKPRRKSQRKLFQTGVMVMALGALVLSVTVAVLIFRQNTAQNAESDQGPGATPAVPATPTGPAMSSEEYGLKWLDTFTIPPPLTRLERVDPPISGGTPQELLDAANLYAATHPQNYRTIIACFEKVSIEAVPESDVYLSALKEMEAWSKRRDEVGLKEVQVYISRLEQSGNDAKRVPGGFRVWTEFPGEMRSDNVDRAIWEYLFEHPPRRRLRQ